MDDLNGLDWSSSTNAAKPALRGTGNYYPPLPLSSASSGRATPTTTTTTTSSLLSKPISSQTKSGNNDSFSNLVSFGSGKPSNNLSLAEQQAKLQSEKARKAEEQQRLYDAQFGNIRNGHASGAQPDNSVSSNLTTFFPPKQLSSQIPGVDPLKSVSSQPSATTSFVSHEDDLFAAFSKDAKVDASSHYPPPVSSHGSHAVPIPIQTPRIDLNDLKAWSRTAPTVTTIPPKQHDEVNDDPFGLKQLAQHHPQAGIQQQGTMDNDDDLLGDLGKPVEDIKKKMAAESYITSQSAIQASIADGPDDPWDKAVNELIDMGFAPEKARSALTESGSGLDVQAAVGWLLNDAHRQSKSQSQSRNISQRQRGRLPSTLMERSQEESVDSQKVEAIPPWMQQSRDRPHARRDASRSSTFSEGDITKTATVVGTNLLKTANSLWKTSQKKVQQAVSEFSQEQDSIQPKWMRSGVGELAVDMKTKNDDGMVHRSRQNEFTSSVTDEALMLEAGTRPQSNLKKSSPTVFNTDARSIASSRNQSPAISNPGSGRSTPISRSQTSTPSNMSTVEIARMRMKKEAGDQSTQRYVRRRDPIAVETEEPDLLSGMSSTLISTPTTASKPSFNSNSITEPAQPASSSASKQISRPPARVSQSTVPTRSIPAISPTILTSSNRHRLAGTEHFKRGDYASAHASYSSSLSVLPSGHPITIVLLCNRSLTSLKTGDPKQAVSDADNALSVIGANRGEGEIIELEGNKPMKGFWGKALSRKAEALEQMERWADAKDVWQMAIEAGSGGASAAQGRQRCEKALAPKPKPLARAPASTKQPTTQAKDSEAVTRLRAANAASIRADDERFALSDSVDARIKAWRDGRQDNLRALLGGLDQVLWSDSGWKKVGMSDLVMTNKVKINYMKAIAKVHPDKVCIPSYLLACYIADNTCSWRRMQVWRCR